MDETEPSSRVDLRYVEKKIIFSLCDCSTEKNLSFYGLTKQEAERFLKRLQHIEKMTWGQLSAAPRESGITREISGTKSFSMVDRQNTSETKFTEKYYFHFRVDQKGVFRVFGYQRDQFFYITHIDSSGRIHH